ncbi:MAG: glycosyltransferase family 1 protein [Thermaerobacter sp.]|nr:glycosyltransferase family 1 protein [Thermaerobacter sp.]
MSRRNWLRMMAGGQHGPGGGFYVSEDQAGENRRLTIGIDGRPLRTPTTGIGVYSRETLAALAGLRPAWRFVVYIDGVGEMGHELVAQGALRLAACAIRPAVLWRHVWLLPRLLRDRVDVLWSPLGVLPMVCPVPAVVTIHDVLWKDLMETLTPRDHLTRRTQMGRSLHVASRIVAVSRFTADRLRAHYPAAADKIRVIRQGPGQTPGLVLTPFGLTSGQPYLLSLGGAEPRKNNGRLVQAFRQSRLPTLGWRLIVVGREAVARFAGPAVLAFEHVDRDLLEALLAGAAAIVVPSLYEGFGLPVLEAVVRRRPLLLSDIAPFREFGLPDGRRFFRPDDVTDMIRVLNQCSAKELLADLEKSQRTVAMGSWRAAAAHFAEVLEDAAGRRREKRGDATDSWAMLRGG